MDAARGAQVLGETSMRLIRLVIWYSPVGIVFLVAKEVLDMEDVASLLASLGLYMLTVLMYVVLTRQDNQFNTVQTL